MFSPRPCLRILKFPLVSPRHSRHLKHSAPCNPKPDTDAYGIPLGPTWSVDDLLSSYPKPKITSKAFQRLHELSALLPPEEGTPEHAKLKVELEELIRLVEAMKLVEAGSTEEDVPDARIWAEGTGLPLVERMATDDQSESGQALLRHAAKTFQSMYVVEVDRRRT